MTKKTQPKKPIGMIAAHAVPLKLPNDDLKAYDRRPWRCLRDVVAHARFRAEQMRATAEGRAFDLARALSAMETCPFRWDATEAFNDKSSSSFGRRATGKVSSNTICKTPTWLRCASKPGQSAASERVAARRRSGV